MKSFPFVFLSLMTSLSFLFGQVPADYFQQHVDYTINVTLDDVNHTLEGDIKMVYTNHSPDALNEIYFHLWANAYKDRTTQFAKQQLRNNNTKFHFSKNRQRGNFYDLSFAVDGQQVAYEVVDHQLDVVKITLPKTLQPNESITISTPLNLKIPESFSRLGHVGTSYQMTQWYPKPAVYDREGWHPMPYLNQGEFYSEFGNFDVSITLPDNYYVGATGVLQNEEEIERINQRILETKQILADTAKEVSFAFPPSSETFKTIRYIANNVHDFAWFADKRFYIEKSKVELPNNTVDTYTFFTDQELNLWRKGIDYVDRAVEFYSKNVGEYPYPHATAVQSALSAGGGMEYPMITVIGLSGNDKSLDQVITHEVGHNWFYGILGFNEREHPWLDEGINSYYDHRYIEKYYSSNIEMQLPHFFAKNLDRSMSQLGLLIQQRKGEDQGPMTHSMEFSLMNYFLEAYEKPAMAFSYLEKYLGTENFDAIMQDMYQKWAFKHPAPQDVISHFNNSLDQDINWFWDGMIGSNKDIDISVKDFKAVSNDTVQVQIVNKGDIAIPVELTTQGAESEQTNWVAPVVDNTTVSIPFENATKVIFDLKNKSTDINTSNNIAKPKKKCNTSLGFFMNFNKSRKRQIFWMPSLGYNKYDGMMLGLGLHNYSIPMPKFRANIFTMYGFRSKEIVGTAYLHYDHVLKSKKVRKIQYSLFSKRFSLKEKFTNTYSLKDSKYETLVPRINVVFEHRPFSQTKSNLELATHWVELISQADQNSPKINKSNVFVRLTYAYQKTKQITPWKVAPFVEYQNYFSFDNNYNRVKLGLTSEWKYQYKKKRHLKFRLYGAIFPYLENTNLAIGDISAIVNGERNNPNDYRYEYYFLGREEFEGVLAQEIKLDQGGFRLGNAQAYQQYLRTNSYMVSLNTTFDLPFKLGNWLGLYADVALIGESRNVVRPNFSDLKNTLIYTGGIKFGKEEYACIYFPLLVSDNINHIYSNWGQKIAFVINLNNFEPNKIYENFAF